MTEFKTEQEKNSQESPHDSISNLKKIARVVFDLFKGAIILFIIALLFRIFIFQPFIVDGPSMEPNFQNNEYILVEKISQHFKDYKRGNVVVFKYPKNPKLTFIKRIIGLPGEKIQIINNKIKIINNQNHQGFFLQETYEPIAATENLSNYNTLVLGQNEYFVMGDNRTNSLDSRDFGPVAKDLIVGKAWFSFRNFHFIPKVQYNAFLSPFKKLSFHF